MKRTALNFLCCVICNLVVLFQVDSQVIDSLEQYDQANDFLSLRKAVLMVDVLDARLGYYLARSYNSYQVDEALMKSDSLLALPFFSKNSNWKDRTLSHVLSLERKKGLYEKVMKDGRSMLMRITDERSVFDVSHNISISFRRLNQYDSAMKWGLPLLNLAEGIRDNLRRHRAVQNMANLYSSLKEYNKSLSMEKSLILLADSMKNTDLRILDRCNLGSSYVNLKKYDSARFYFDEALLLARNSSQSKRIPLILYNLGSLEYGLDQYSKAIELLNECIDQSIEANQPPLVTRSRYLLSLCYRQQGKVSEVMNMLSQGIADAEKYGLKQDKAYFLNLRADLQNKNGDYIDVIATLQSLRLLEDSILNDKRVRAIEELKTQHDTEKKERQIESLRQGKTISELQIRQKNALLVGGAILVVVLAMIGYVFYRNRTLRLAQERLVTEQQLLRSQMNPHFLFNALSSIHSYVYEGDRRQAADYLATFGELTRDILDQSSVDWITLQKELKTIQQYIEIQQIRFPHVSSETFLSDNIMVEDMSVPPVLLQPFIENAFEHGLSDQKEGAIKIRIDLMDESNIIFEIEDDGVGLNASQSRHESKAISITRKRLELSYGKGKFGLQVSNADGSSGVLVRMVLPMKQEV